MKLLSIVGARPQFVKVAVIVDALRHADTAAAVEHRILHTGQHYDAKMSDSFFRQLDIPEPDFHLGIGSGGHGAQTGAMLAGIEGVLAKWRPDVAIVYGDTNSTLAGALAAAKMHIPLVHVEAGLRSFNRLMPEEINRIATDHVSTLLLCPTETAMRNAHREGLAGLSTLTGDVMLDMLLKQAPIAPVHPLVASLVKPRAYALVTMHRAENSDNPARLREFLDLLEKLPIPVVFPMHPRIEGRLSGDDRRQLESLSHIHLIGPSEYFEMLALARDAAMILTDSGGLQKEAYFLSVPCLTLRNETEWSETLCGGWNRVVGTRAESVLPVVNSLMRGNGAVPAAAPDLSRFGAGKAGQRSVEAILSLQEGIIQ